MSLGERIRKARDAKGLKQSELAELIDVKSAGVISNWEKDINKPDADKIIKLCEVLDISASYLLDYYGNSINISLKEQEYINKYRVLDSYGKRVVASVLNIEFERCSNIVQAGTEDDLARIAAFGGGTFDVPAANVTAEELEALEEKLEREKLKAEILEELKREKKSEE